MLEKNHDIQTNLSRSGKRIKKLQEIQTRKERKPLLGTSTKPANAIRWQGKLKEAERTNMIMGDMSDCLAELYSKGGVDYGNLTSQEKETGVLDRVLYTAEDKMMLRQYEAAATPAAILCKYFQDNRNASPYLLFMG